MRLVVAALVARSGGGKESREEGGKDASDLEPRDFFRRCEECESLGLHDHQSDMIPEMRFGISHTSLRYLPRHGFF